MSVQIIWSVVAEYKTAYENIREELRFEKLLSESYEKKIKKLEKENKAYKILLKKELLEEE